MFKLRLPTEHPEEHTIHLAYNYQGFVGVLLFEGGKWYELNGRGKELMSTTSGIVWLSAADSISNKGAADGQKN